MSKQTDAWERVKDFLVTDRELSDWRKYFTACASYLNGFISFQTLIKSLANCPVVDVEDYMAEARRNYGN